MIPTMIGRIQTRIWLVLFVAAPWTAIITPFLPVGGRSYDIGWNASHLYPVTFAVLATVLVISLVAWEWIYYVLQLCRWEKDWPAMFFMLEVVPEAIVAFVVLKAFGNINGINLGYAPFITHILTSWFLMWLVALGPMKVLFIRWRFNGGRMLW